MFRLHEGWDYTVYKIYVIGGIAALIGIPIALALVLQDRFPSENFFRTYMIFLTAWISGLLGYWWWVFLFKENKKLRQEDLCVRCRAADQRIEEFDDLTPGYGPLRR